MGDDILRQFLTSLPVNWQHTLRDWGLIKYLSDFAALIMIPAMTITVPRVAFHTLQCWAASRYIPLSKTDRKSVPGLELHRLVDTTAANDVETANNDKLKRVFLFVHGGAWGSGQLWQYRDFAVQCGKLLEMDAVVLLKYAYYPESMILEQRDVVLQAIQFIHSKEFHHMLGLEMKLCSQIEIVVCGHSSGAHIAVLSAVEILRSEMRSVDKIDSTLNRPLLHSVIGLSGPYDIVKHFDFESQRSVQHISPMLGAAGNNIEGLAVCSPDVQLLSSEFDALSEHVPETSIRATKFHFLHGNEDSTVPHEASERMVAALNRRGFRFVNGYYYAGHHLQSLFDVILSSSDSSNETKSVLRRIAQE
jgi:acetyl esterase/lipase